MGKYGRGVNFLPPLPLIKKPVLAGFFISEGLTGLKTQKRVRLPGLGEAGASLVCGAKAASATRMK
jgi:hypothetical protein